MIYLASASDQCINTGDVATIPSKYFDFEHKRIPFGETVPSGAKLIVSGGGILQSEKHCYELYLQIASARKAVIWGAGLQYPFGESRATGPAWLYNQKNLLAGVRDTGLGLQWVPCVSCMSSLFDNPPQPSRDVVCYFGSEWFDSKKYPLMKCHEYKSMEEVVSFLASARTIVTSSYHGMYWGTLLGRNVVAIPSEKNSKFYRFPFTSTISSVGTWERDLNNHITYPHALDVCRAATRKFYHQATAFLNQP